MVWEAEKKEKLIFYLIFADMFQTRRIAKLSFDCRSFPFKEKFQ